MASPNNGKKKVSKKAAKKSPKEITFHYIKTPSYRSYHVDGVYGCLTPKGNLYCEFFIDRSATPQTAVHELSEDGYLSGKPKKTIGKKGFIREIECGIMLDIDTALSLKNWLEGKIREYEKTSKSFKKGKK